VFVKTTITARLPIVVTTALLAVAACESRSSDTISSRSLRFGIFSPDATASEPELQARLRPVASYLTASLGRPVDLMMSPDAGRVLGDFEAGRLDAIFDRAIAFPHAEKAVGAIPLVTRQEDRHVTTVFLASSRDPRRSLEEFRGSRFDFSLRLGSSYVMGRQYLEQRKIDPGTFFREVHFSKVADEAIDRVRNGQADLCVANSQALVRLRGNRRLNGTELKIVAETPPHVGQLWFVARELPRPVRNQIRDAFLSLSPDDADHARVLAVLGASGYVPVIGEDYQELTDLMRRMQLLDFDGRQMP